MKKVLFFLNNIERYLIYVLFFALVCLVFTQVVARYVFSTAWGWMETLTRVLFVYITYIGASWAAKAASHLRVSAGAELLPGKYTKNILFLIGNSTLVGVCAYFGYQLSVMTYTYFLQGVAYAGAEWLPIWVMYLGGVLGFVGITIRTIQGGVIPEIQKIVQLSHQKPENQDADTDPTKGA